MDALITIIGKQRSFGDTEDDIIEVTAVGNFYEKEDAYYLFYEEQLEGYEGISRSRLKIQPNHVEMTKKGAMENHMVFELGKKTNSMYRTEYGLIEMGMDTDRVDMKLENGVLELHLHYVMEMNCALVGENTLYIRAVLQ